MAKPQRLTVGPESTDSQIAPTEPFAAGDAEIAAAPAATVGPKKATVRASKVKPCVRCEERRAREREYAKSSRLRLRLAAAEKAPASGGGPATTSPDAGGANESAQEAPPS